MASSPKSKPSIETRVDNLEKTLTRMQADIKAAKDALGLNKSAAQQSLVGGAAPTPDQGLPPAGAAPGYGAQ
jgi:hypothetical protein